MGTPTLFGDADTLKKPAPFVARRLKRLGVAADVLDGLDATAAFAMLDRLEVAREALSGPSEPDRPYPGGSAPERLAVAAAVEAALAAGLSGERLLSMLECSLYALDGPALARLAPELVWLLRHDRLSPAAAANPARIHAARVWGGLGI